jgi:hypothetical protein
MVAWVPNNPLAHQPHPQSRPRDLRRPHSSRIWHGILQFYCHPVPQMAPNDRHVPKHRRRTARCGRVALLRHCREMHVPLNMYPPRHLVRRSRTRLFYEQLRAAALRRRKAPPKEHVLAALFTAKSLTRSLLFVHLLTRTGPCPKDVALFRGSSLNVQVLP